MDDLINYYPVIAEAEYPAFVALPVAGIQPTYSEWIAQQRAANLAREQVGEKGVGVPVRLADFQAFCDARGHGCVAQWLSHYAMEHGPRR